MSDNPLVIRHLEFLGGMAVGGEWRPDSDLPEVAFAGRSNVGKSSLLNMIVQRRAFARVSNTPGRTQEINFFRVNKAFVIVDLPGYGYAKVARTKREAWGELIDEYFRKTKMLKGVVVLLDARREPSPEDLAMLDHLSDLEIPTLVAATKIDKLAPKARETQLALIRKVAGLEDEQLVPCSSVTREGREEIAEALLSLVGPPTEVAAE